MKKYILLSIVAVMIVISIFIINSSKETQKEYKFEGKIIEVNETNVVVINIKDDHNLIMLDAKVRVAINEDITFEINDIIEVSHDGTIKEIDPLGINEINIKKIN